MNRYWNLGEELYNLLHRWPSMLLAIALGCVLGVALSWIWPPSYQSDTSIYVGLNPYRTYSDTRFLALARPKYSNLDNYHYWQMSQLNAALFTSEWLRETLKDLRDQDPYWNDVSIEQLQGMLDATWRSSGNWNLIAEHPQAEHARQASQAWSAVAVKHVQSAVEAARKTISLDDELHQAAENITGLQARQAALQSGLAALQAWQSTAAGKPGQDPLPAEEFWRLLALIKAVSSDTPSWSAILQSAPVAGAPVQAYQQWAGQALAQAQAELDSLPGQINELQNQQQSLSADFDQASQDSLGFSPNLEFQDARLQPTEALRPTGIFILCGGIIGLLAWLLVQLALISRRAEREPAADPAGSPGQAGHL
jgi:hypothetical protein